MGEDSQGAEGGVMLGASLRDLRALFRVVSQSPRPKGDDGDGSIEPGVRGCLRLAGRLLCNDSVAVLLLWRARRSAQALRIPLANTLLRRVQTTLYGIEIDRRARIGEGVWFVHTVGTVVGGDSRLGDRVRLMGANTVGTNIDDGFPRIGDDVVLGVGARVLGPVRIGDGARIGAGAVVLRDVPAGAVAVGIPARVVPRRGSEQKLRSVDDEIQDRCE